VGVSVGVGVRVGTGVLVGVGVGVGVGVSVAVGAVAVWVARILAAIWVDVAAKSGVGIVPQPLNRQTVILINIHNQEFWSFIANLLVFI
jgi:hypothetical protein